MEALWLLGCTGWAPPDNEPVELLMYGGQAGPGKSHLLRMLAADQALRLPGSRFCIVRRKFPDLLQNHAAKFHEEIPEKVAHFNMTRMELEWFNGSVTELHHCLERMSHVDYKGFEWPAGLGIDEAVDLYDDQLLYFFSRVRGNVTRWPDVQWRKKAVFATNPYGESHLFLKSTFVDGRESGVPFAGPPQEMPNPDDLDGPPLIQQFRYCFLRAELKDNPSLDYADTMAGILSNPDERRRRAEAYGDWDLPGMGQFFEEFDKSVHVVKPFDIPGDWVRWRGIDWGISHPTVVLWAARNPKTGQIVVYREWAAMDGVKHVPAGRVAILIKGMSYNDPPISLTMADPSMKKSTGIGPTVGSLFHDNGVTLTYANNNRPGTLAHLKQLLSYDQSYGREPGLVIFDTCHELIKELANIRRDERPGHWEDLKQPQNLTDLRDDAIDCCLVGETKVLTNRGEVPLSEVKQWWEGRAMNAGDRESQVVSHAGDVVWTRGGWRNVKKVFSKQTPQECLRIKLSTGRDLVLTPEHRVWVEGPRSAYYAKDGRRRGNGETGWYEAKDLLLDDLLTYHTRIVAKEWDGPHIVYDLSVDDDEYPEFVAEGVIVHNCRYLVQAAYAVADTDHDVRTYKTVDRAAVMAAAERRRRRY